MTGGDQGDWGDQGVTQRVGEMGDCQDTETHCQTVEHAEHHLKGSSQVTRGDRG